MLVLLVLALVFVVSFGVESRWKNNVRKAFIIVLVLLSEADVVLVVVI